MDRVEVTTVDLRGVFLPRDRDKALRDVAERLYKLHADVSKEAECDWIAFRIENILDIIERS